MKTKGRPQQIYTEEQKSAIKKTYKETHNSKDRSRLTYLHSINFVFATTIYLLLLSRLFAIMNEMAVFCT